MANDRIWRVRDLVAMVGRSRSSIYADVAHQRFPQPIQIGPRAVGWRDSEIQAWIESRARTKSVRGEVAE